MASPAHHPGLVKWFNVKAGYGFIQDQNTGTDVFCHASGLTRPLKECPPREGDQVLLAVREGDKGPEAWDVAPVSTTSLPSKTWNRSPRPRQGGSEEDIQAKIYACIYTAKALAGGDHRHLQELIPVILQHNGLPVVYIPKNALLANTRANPRLSRRGLPGARGKTEESPVAAPHTQLPTTGAETEPTGDKPRNLKETKETQDDVPREEEEEEEDDEDDDDDDEEEDEEEDEEVDVLGSGSEGEATSLQGGKPSLPSDPQPLSGKQEDDGWVTKTKRRRRPSPNAARWVLPKAERKTTPTIALRESPTVTKLRQEKRTGKVREDVLSGVYIHEENRFVGNIKGYTGFDGYLSHKYPKDSSAPLK